MPEGDSLHRAARRLQPLVGERVRAESPHPRGQVTGVAARVDGRTLESVEAVGKNLLLRFEGGVLVRSHLGMVGRWWLQRAGEPRRGSPWLVLRGSEYEAVLFRGSTLELVGARPARLGPDLLAPDFDPDAALARLRAAGTKPIGEALLDQRLVAGIGNLWRAEALWVAEVSPWKRVADLEEDELGRVLDAARSLMRAALDEGRQARRVYRRAGRPCARCGTPIRSRGQGDANRTAYWCPVCQPSPGDGPAAGASVP